MESDAQFTGCIARRSGIGMLQAILVLVLQAGPAAAQPAVSCKEPAAAVKSSMLDNACILKANIGFASPYEFPAWKTVDIGIYYNANAVRDAFRTAPDIIRTEYRSNQMLSRMTFLQTDARLNLVLTTVADLGFGEDGASLKDIYERASQLGLALCPAELGPALRLAYLNQPFGEYLRIAMEPIAIAGGEAAVFTVAKGLAGLLLIGDDVRDDLVLAGNMRLVFVRPDTAPYRSYRGPTEP